MTTFDYRSVDLDNILNNTRPAASSMQKDGSRAFWNAKQESSMILYFVTDPWTRDEDHGWHGWREIFAKEGFAGGIEPPLGLRGIPVDDSQGVEGDPLLALVNPYMTQDSDTPQRPVSTKAGVNIVEIVGEGESAKEYHKVLVLTASRYRKLISTINSWREMNDDFSLIGRRFRLAFEGKGFTEIVSLTPIKDVPPIDLPEPFDIAELLQERRNILLDHIESQSGIDLSDFRDTEEMTVTDPDSEESVEIASVTPTDLYDSMTDSRIKSALVKKGIAVKPRITRAELISLAVENL
jgi:hypothetical protein